jgi:lipid-binding SYLF domain-containing protein
MLRVLSIPAIAGTVALGLMAAPSTVVGASPETNEAALVVSKATVAVRSFQDDVATRSELSAALRNATGVLIVPGYVRAGVGIGGEGGTGVLLRRDPANGRWSYPAFFDLRAATLGPQLGYQTADLIMVVENAATLQTMLNGKFSFGADAVAVAGRDGVQTGTVTQDGRKALALRVFARTAGAFAGATVKGGTIESNAKLDVGYYGPGATAPRIIGESGLRNADAEELRSVVAGIAAGSAAMRR